MGRVRTIILVIFLFFLLGSFLPTLFHRDSGEVKRDETGSGPAQVLDIEENDEALRWRLRMIRSAKQEIILSTFDFGNDESGRALIAALRDAAGRGVRVKVLLDDLNYHRRQTFSDEMACLSTTVGAEIRRYNPVDFLRPWKFNYRMHDKYLIIDRKICLLGGRNSNDLFLGHASEVQNIDRDVVAVPVYGDETSPTFLDALLSYFDALWGSGKCTGCRKSLSVQKADEVVRELDRYCRDYEKEYPGTFDASDPEALKQEGFMFAQDVRLLTNSSRTGDHGGVIFREITDMLEEDGGDLFIETPYIICDLPMYQKLSSLAEEQDSMKIEVLTNAVESGANSFGCSDYLNQSGRIRKNGMEVCECMAPHSLHAKAFLAGDALTIVGSCNLDIRSTYLDTELMLAVRSKEFNAKIRENLEEKKQYGRIRDRKGEIVWTGEKYESRKMPLPTKIRYGILRVLSPIIRPIL